jgi:hypothetical protein
MNRIAVMLALLTTILFSYKATAQEKVYSFFGQYLVKVHEIDSAIYHVKKVRRKEEIVTNYYVDELDTFKLSTAKLILFKFGSYSDHTRPHLGLLKADDFRENCIIDCSDIQSDIKNMFDFLNAFSAVYGKGFEKIRTGVMTRIIKAYPDYPYWRSP